MACCAAMTATAPAPAVVVLREVHLDKLAHATQMQKNGHKHNKQVTPTMPPIIAPKTGKNFNNAVCSTESTDIMKVSPDKDLSTANIHVLFVVVTCEKVLENISTIIIIIIV